MQDSYNVSFEKTFLNDKVCWEDYIYAFMTKRKMKDYYAKADYHLLCSENDSKPEEVFLKMMDTEKKRHFKNVIKRILKSVKL